MSPVPTPCCYSVPCMCLSNLQTNGYDYDVSRTCIWHLGKCKRRHNQRMPHRLLQHLRCTLHLLTGGSTMPLFLQMRWMMNTLFFQHGANRLYSRHYNGFDFFQWPREPVGPLGHQCGVTWAELALSWMYFHRSYLPIRRLTAEGTDVILTPANFFRAKEWRVTLTEMGSSCQHLVEHLRALIPTKVTPAISTGKVSSLYVRGCGAFHQGVRTRPVFPCQAEVSDFIQNMLVAGRVKLIELTPNVATEHITDTILPDHFAQRQRRARLAMVGVRKKRRLGN